MKSSTKIIKVLSDVVCGFNHDLQAHIHKNIIESKTGNKALYIYSGTNEPKKYFITNKKTKNSMHIYNIGDLYNLFIRPDHGLSVPYKNKYLEDKCDIPNSRILSPDLRKDGEVIGIINDNVFRDGIFTKLWRKCFDFDIDIWSDIETYEELQKNTIKYLLGHIRCTPYCATAINDESEEILDDLVAINYLGAVTTDSEPQTCDQCPYVELYLRKGQCDKFIRRLIDIDENIKIIETQFGEQKKYDKNILHGFTSEIEKISMFGRVAMHVNDDGSPCFGTSLSLCDTRNDLFDGEDLNEEFINYLKQETVRLTIFKSKLTPTNMFEEIITCLKQCQQIE